MEHGAGASHKHLGRSQRNISERGHTSHWLYVNEPENVSTHKIFGGLKGCNSIIRFKDPRKTCLSVWVGAELRG